MAERANSSDWWGGADVCVALIDAGRPVDWSSGRYEPELQVWIPEESFVCIAKAAEGLGLHTVQTRAVLSGEQVSLSSEASAQLLSGWAEVEDAVAQSPADGWAAAVRLLLQQCDPTRELLLEGP